MPQRQGGDEDLELASLDFLGDTAELRAQAQEQVREAGAKPQPPGPQEGADQSGSVWVSIDPEGQVQGVEISRHWQDRMEAGAFPTALFGAYADAVRKLINADAVAALAAQEDAGEPLESDRPSVPDSHPAPPRGVPEPQVDEREWLAATWDLLQDIDDQLRRLDQINITVDERDRRTTTLTSPQGCLTARIEGQAITEITGDSQRIRAAGNEQLRLEALALFRAAAEHSTDPSPL